MQIKPYDAALTPGSTSPATLRPSDGSLLSPKLPIAEGDNVSLSNGVRSLAAALRAALPMLEAARIAELLTPRDRFVLVRALDLAHAENLDAQTVHALIVDLSSYRALEQRERAPSLLQGPDDVHGASHPGPTFAPDLAARSTRAPRFAPPAQTTFEARAAAAEASAGEAVSPDLPARGAQPARLTLPVFSPADEALARSLLTVLALRDTVVDHGFVRALVDPDRTPSHAVDFSFLRRLVLSLSPSHADGAPDPAVTLARRDTRAALATALTELALAHDQLPAPTPHVLAQGRALLRARLLALAPRLAPSEGRQPPLLALRSDDRKLLGVLYLVRARAGGDLRVVDEVAQALVALRRTERAALTSVQRALTITTPPESEHVEARSEAPRAPGPQEPHSMRPPHAQLQLARQLETSARNSMLPLAEPTPTRSAGSDEVVSAQSSMPPLAEPTARRSGQNDEEPSPPPARNFGSSSQLAAKASGSYRSLAPPAAWPGPSARELAAQPLAGPLAREPLQPIQAAPALTRPLDLSQALGLGAWFAQARGQARRALRPRRLYLRPEAAIHAVTAARETAGEAEADDPPLDGSHRRRRVRWQLLIQRRRHTRKRKH